ncbi:WAS/WASL-interacting protein family member 1-like [Eucalyptus grandis]|uniref:WAS/WASL-interacting protein family member 1-like n=1 Tax=Eucalyptus grandis TaxID=71139 RepID=UPI00192F03DB|nr:WAS/WASL-interacting protein family member 1-like [Eucalyptus grandis]
MEVISEASCDDGGGRGPTIPFFTLAVDTSLSFPEMSPCTDGSSSPVHHRVRTCAIAFTQPRHRTPVLTPPPAAFDDRSSAPPALLLPSHRFRFYFTTPAQPSARRATPPEPKTSKQRPRSPHPQPTRLAKPRLPPLASGSPPDLFAARIAPLRSSEPIPSPLVPSDAHNNTPPVSSAPQQLATTAHPLP